MPMMLYFSILELSTKKALCFSMTERLFYLLFSVYSAGGLFIKPPAETFDLGY